MLLPLDWMEERGRIYDLPWLYCGARHKSGIAVTESVAEVAQPS